MEVKLIDKLKRRLLFLHMQEKHKDLLQKIKGKDKIKVLFLAIHKSIWKVDPVFQKMLTDPLFEPLILVCPYTPYGEERMWQDMQECYEYFEQKGYPLLSSYNKEEQRWITLEEINPDIVFFTNPHNLTRKEYYEDAYLDYLSCYAGYGMHTAYYSNASQYNQEFHNAVWKIFVQNKEMYHGYIEYSCRPKNNIHIIIDCIVESILEYKDVNHSVWKENKNHKKIIFAPHHTIENDAYLQLGNFLSYADLMRQLVVDTRDTITWSFKPHPILKSKLYSHPDWGIEKTDEYYLFWQSQANSQLDEGEYIELFKQSDAMIHDSASFIAEYMFVNKPMLYLVNNHTRGNLNKFGNSCLDVSEQAINAQEIKEFVCKVIDGFDRKQQLRYCFINDYFEGLTSKSSSVVINILKESIK